MIRDREIFEDAHLPQRLQYREGELKVCIRALDPGARGRGLDDIMISGASGVGKTALAGVALRTLRARGVRGVTIESLGATTGSILRQAIEGLPWGPTEVPSNRPIADVHDHLQELVDERPAVLVLDEADDLPGSDALQTLHATRGIALAVICHHPDEWLAAASDDVQDRIRCGAHITLDRYSVVELADILQVRADRGLYGDVVSREQLERIADDVVGVARDGIQTMRAAAELAAERGHTTIQDGDITDGYGRAQERIRELNLQSLPFAHLFLYELIRQAGEIDSATLHDRYDDLAEEAFYGRPAEPVTTDRARRLHLEKLREYDLIETTGTVHRPVDTELNAPATVALEPNSV